VSPASEPPIPERIIQVVPDTHDYLQQLRAARPIMEAERDALPADSPLRPSRMWEDLRGFFDFVFDLSDRSLQNIRLHTSLMTGDPWFGNMQYAGIARDEDKRHIPMIGQYERVIAGLPERFWIGEPVPARETESVGVRYRGRLVTDDIVRYQRCIANLYWSGVYRLLESLPEPPVIVEIGGGYGGLAHQVAACLGRRCTYAIFDLPETLYWSAAFLIVNNPGKRFYIYPGRERDRRPLADICRDHEFLLFPNYAIDRLAELEGIDLFVNMLSFQEMNDAQLETYLLVAGAHVRGALYSENRSRHPQNPDLAHTVEDHLARMFTLTPDPSFWRAKYPNANSFSHPQWLWQLFPYVGLSRRRPATLTPVDSVIFTSDRRHELPSTT
jgi:hypothetical protein